MAQLRTDKEVLQKQLERADAEHKAELAKLAQVGGQGGLLAGWFLSCPCPSVIHVLAGG